MIFLYLSQLLVKKITKISITSKGNMAAENITKFLRFLDVQYIQNYRRITHQSFC